MGRVKRWALLFAVLLISAGVTAYGLWLFHNALIEYNRTNIDRAKYVFFGGMTVVPIVLFVFINCFIKSERELPRPVRKGPAFPRNFKKSETLIRRMHFAKRHPSVVFLFFIMSLLISGVMSFAPELNPDLHDAHFLQFIGIVLFLAYFVALIFLVYGLFTKKWEPYMDTSIQRLERQLADAKTKDASAYDNPPAVE
jgi:Na+/melibiose symporter-like transporter